MGAEAGCGSCGLDVKDNSRGQDHAQPLYFLKSCQLGFYLTIPSMSRVSNKLTDLGLGMVCFGDYQTSVPPRTVCALFVLVALELGIVITPSIRSYLIRRTKWCISDCIIDD